MNGDLKSIKEAIERSSEVATELLGFSINKKDNEMVNTTITDNGRRLAVSELLFNRVPQLKEDIGEVLDTVEMNQREVEGINRILKYICRRTGIDWDDVVRYAIFEMDEPQEATPVLATD